MGRRRIAAGFSVLELMMTVMIMAALLAIAVPAWRTVVRRNYVSTTVNNLVADMQYARSEAASRHQFVSICRSVSGTGCDVGGVNYDAGYIVYVYNAAANGANQSFGAVSGLTLLRRVQALPDVSIQATDGNVITFGQTGSPIANGSRTALTMVVCARSKSGATDVGQNTTTTPGARISLGVSGSIASSKLAAGAACTAS